MTLIAVPFHIGIVVSDLESSATQLTAMMGTRWADVVENPTQVDTPEGRKKLTLRLQYSLNGPPYLELVLRQPGTVWEHLGLHHLGMWTSDPHADSARLETLGCKYESVMLDEDGNWFGGLYHRTSDGVRFELSNISKTGPWLAGYLSGGDELDR